MSEDERDETVVLDMLAHGRSDDDRPQHRKEPLAYLMGLADFELYECVVADPSAVSIGDRFAVDADVFETVRRIDYADLPSGAASELEYAVADLVAENEQRFVDFYNEAQPISLRLHQLNLLPGIGKKLRNGILDSRDRRPFESFEDLEARVDGLHNSEKILVERIIEELREDDLKYRNFVGREPGD
jgi:putative nucleotide binding protein